MRGKKTKRFCMETIFNKKEDIDQRFDMKLADQESTCFIEENIYDTWYDWKQYYE